MASVSELIRQIARCPYRGHEAGGLIDGSNDIPYAKELDFYVDGESSLELYAQFETLSVISCVHRIREGQLFDVAWREKPNFLEHASKSTCGEGTTRETENTNLIPDVI